MAFLQRLHNQELSVHNHVSETKRFLGDNKAVTALEYGIIASILGLVLVGIFTTFGQTLTTLFSSVATSV